MNRPLCALIQQVQSAATAATIGRMFNIVLFQPEIPPNTGNVIRLCANTGCTLHLVAPLGFELDDRRLRRAGLDYHEWASMEVHDSLEDFRKGRDTREFALSTRGGRLYSDIAFRPGDSLVFGPETRGLPQAYLEELGADHCLRLPMREHSRSLNLSNAVAAVTYEALRQNGFGELA